MTEAPHSLHVQFEIRAVEDREATIQRGCTMTRDADFAIFRMSGDKNTALEIEVTPEEIARWRSTPHKKHIPALYEAWKQGQAEPVHGIALTQWPQITPSQIRMAEALSIHSVEDFANLSESGCIAFGAGGITLKQKAKAYLEAAAGPGRVAEKMGAMDAEMQMMRDQLAALQKANAEKDAAIAALAKREGEDEVAPRKKSKHAEAA